MSAQSTIRHAYDRAFHGDRNLDLGERIVSTGLGLAVAAGGLRKGASLSGAIMGLVGAALVARGMSGHCPVKEQVEARHRNRLGDRLGHDGEAVRGDTHAPMAGMR